MQFLSNLVSGSGPSYPFQFHLYSQGREDHVLSPFSEKPLLIDLITYAVNQIRKEYKNEKVTMTHSQQGHVSIQNIADSRLEHVSVRTQAQEHLPIDETPGVAPMIASYVIGEDGNVVVKKIYMGQQKEEVKLTISSLKNLNKIHENIDNNVKVRQKVKVGADGMTQHQFMQQGQKEREEQPTQLRKYTEQEVAAHSSPGDCWCIFQNQVYDMSSYVASHPGGRHILEKEGGKSIDSLVQEYHPWVNVKHILRDKHLGSVDRVGMNRKYLGI